MKYKLKGENILYPAMDTIFKNRGIKDYNDFLEIKDKDEINYNKLMNINEGIELLLKHIENKSKIQIIVDCDVDGFTSAALVYDYLQDNFKDINLSYTVHAKKQHGISKDIRIDNDVNLLIIPDASSNDFEQHKYYKNKGVDILVLDHHEVTEDKVSEDAIIINNQLSKEYENKSLSGVGVAYKFIKALNDHLFEPREKVIKYLDLVSLGNVGDGMNLKSKETRFYVKKGLETVENGLIRALMEENSFQLGGKYNIISLGWVIAPKINGVIRRGSIEDKKTVFEAMASIKTNYEEAAKLCTKIKSYQDRIVKAEMRSIQKDIEGQPKYLLLNVNDDLEQSFTGLVANKLKSQYKAPTLLYREKDDNCVGGSARGYEDSIKDFNKLLTESGLFKFCEGHPNSFGFEIHKDNIPKLINYLDKVFESINETDGKEYEVDLILDNDNLDESIVEEICAYEDEWGNGLDEPLLVFKDLELNSFDIHLLGGRAKNIKFKYQGIDFIKKYAKVDTYNEMTAKEECNITLIGKCVNNIYNGYVNPQVEIVDFIINN
ncbi:MAG: DHH family phosphoesterase [Sarcina sp.]